MYEQPGVYHVPNARGLSGGATLTLCSWCDVPYEEHNGTHAPNCGECLAIVRYCKALRLPRA